MTAVTVPSEGNLTPFEVVARTDPGLDPGKQVNEDAFAHLRVTIGELAVVCDGMGGHESGAEASRIAVSTISELVGVAPAGSHPRMVLASAIAEAGARVFAFGGAPGVVGRPGSTCVAALFHPGGVEVAHVGDSRLYVVRGGQIWPLTRDHSVVQHLIDAGVIAPEAAYGHPDSNKITRALGLGPSVEVEARPEPLPFEKGDVFVLASDGLCDLARPDEIRDVVVGARTTEAAADALVAMANARGGHDNITVMLVRALTASSPSSRGGAGAGPAPTVVTTRPEAPPAPEPAGATWIDRPAPELDEPDADARPSRATPPSSATLLLGVGLIVVGAILLAVALFHVLHEPAREPAPPPLAAPPSTPR